MFSYRSILVLGLGLALSFAPIDLHARAQTAGHARVRGEVQGLELALDGGLSAPRGGVLRFNATLYEVLGLSNLRLARGARIEVTHSIDPTAAAIVLTADGSGRVDVALPIPDDAPATFGLVLRAISGPSGTGVQRRFELSISTYDRRSLLVQITRGVVVPHGRVPVLGYLADQLTGRPIGGARIRLTLRDDASRTARPPVVVTTDGSGLFEHIFRLPAGDTSAARVEASLLGEDDVIELTSAANAPVSEPGTTPLRVAIATTERVVAAGAAVVVDLIARTGEGRPVSGATCVIDGLPHDDRGREQRTDERGRARFNWRAPDYPAGWNDATVTVDCTREAIGSGRGQLTLRVSRVERATSFSVEGGALIPSLGGRIWARVVDIDGTPTDAGVAVELTGPRLGTLQGVTDASGVATFDVSLHALPAPSARRAPPRRGGDDDEDVDAFEEEEASIDNCGGEAATEVSIQAAGATALTACVPLDPDGTVRVRAVSAVIAPGGTVEIDLLRTANARLPVAVSLIVLDGGPTAIAQRVVAAGESHLSIPLPDDVGGRPILIRARPLRGTEGREVRGGSAMVWAAPSSWSLDTDLTDGRLRLPSRPSTRAYSIGLPLDEAAVLLSRVETGSALAELGHDLSSATPALFAGALAARTPRDVGAPFVLRGSALTPVPAPSDPAELGLLRDPWRSQARFVTGRLALVFSAIEQQVAAAVPERIEDVAVEANGRFTFNAQILASIAESGLLGAEGATGLGGEDLTVEALRAFDGAFTYDNVARRITRERLFRIMVALRAFVQQNGFDLPWARLGDPSTWLQHLPEVYSEAMPEGSIQPRDLVDGWGRPFVLRAIARARFTGWRPLDGWEVASPGPDGRMSNGDDVFDPTARVLPSASPYAQAVGEDALVARLRGVELGRATVELLASYGATDGYVDGVPESAEEAGASLALSAWSSVPSRILEVIDPLGLRRPDRQADFVLGQLHDLDGALLPLAFDEEPRTWGVVTLGVGADGTFAADLVSTPAGSPLIVEERLPSRVRTGEPLQFELMVTNVSNEDRTFSVASEIEGPLRVRMDESLTVRAGTSAPLAITLEGSGSGRASMRLRFSSGGAVLRTVGASFAVDSGRHPIRTRNAGLVGGGRTYGESFGIPGSATDVAARLVLLSPTGLAYDPDLAEVRTSDPSLLAWSLALAGRPVDDDLRALLLRAQQGDGSFSGTEPALSTACALVALASADEADTDAAAARDRARNGIVRGTPTFLDADGVVGTYRGAAAVLAALAPGGVYDPASGREAASDPVAAYAGRLRTGLRRALRTHPSEPTVMARTAAALLLADPSDARGRAMYERAAAAVAEAPGGRLVTPSDARNGTIEQLTASLALAVAAHQMGDEVLARSLVGAVVYRDNLLLARGGEALFWWLSLGAYGVLGTTEPEAMRVSAGGSSVSAEFVGGVAIVPLANARAGSSASASVDAGEAFVIARLEAVYGLPFESRNDGPFTVELNGDPGGLRRVAALELAITATEEVGRPVLYVQLPGGVDADPALLAAVGSSPYVAFVEARRPGLLRMVLTPLASGTTALVSLPVRWTAHGSVRGLGAIVHPADDPERMTVLAPRSFDIE